MKLDRKPKIPLRHEEDKELFSGNIPNLAAEDAAQVMELVKQSKDQELKDLINKRMTPYEKQYSIRNAGLPTRDYLTALLGETIKKKHPKYEGMAFGSPDDIKKNVVKFRDQFYPGLQKLLKERGMSEVITADPNEGNQYSGRTGLNIDPNGISTAKMLGTIGHEMGHAADYAQENPAYRTTRNEGGYSNPVTPNFEDYNWEGGDFDSDYMRAPMEIQDDVGKDHHLERNYPYENIFNMVKDDKLVEAKPRFSKLNKLFT
jgi:hypothetical protein